MTVLIRGAQSQTLPRCTFRPGNEHNRLRLLMRYARNWPSAKVTHWVALMDRLYREFLLNCDMLPG
jgi:hypothetical protein